MKRNDAAEIKKMKKIKEIAANRREKRRNQREEWRGEEAYLRRSMRKKRKYLTEEGTPAILVTLSQEGSEEAKVHTERKG